MTDEPDTNHGTSPARYRGGYADQPAQGAAAVDQLGPADTGRWLVTTFGSQPVWDLRRRTYQRLPGVGRGRFHFDGLAMAITRVDAWPRVGAVFVVFYDDPTRPKLLEHWRQSSTVERIERLPD